MQRRDTLVIAVVAVLVGGCLSSTAPTPAPSAAGPTNPPSATASGSPAPGPSESPAPTTGAIPPSFPLAVVTGLENAKPGTTVADIQALGAAGKLVLPCGVELTAPAIVVAHIPLAKGAGGAGGGSGGPASTCLPADQIAKDLQAHPTDVALLPAGLVEPATRTLPIGGSGPFGLGGADLFGDPAARALPYPVMGKADGSATLDPAWFDYDPSSVWTLASVGGVCSDAGSAYQALALHKGWDWIFDGGTARYAQGPHLNPSPPAGIGRYTVVSPVDTGHHGAVAQLISGADLTIADVECPIVTNFVPNYGGQVLQFSISSAVLPLWQQKLGFDVVYMAANHNTDKGLLGVQQTLELLPKYDIEGVGLGLDFDQAMAPAYVTRAGVKIAFVAWNDVPGVWKATPTHAGVPWLTQANVEASVKAARAAGAQLVFCDPQWWGGAEYHSDLAAGQQAQLVWFEQAGCDEVVGAGTHLAGPLLLQDLNGHVGMVMASEGNLTFGQNWWQDTQEGVIMTAAFRGPQLVNVRLWPYVMLLNARGALTDPQADGHYVLDRVWKNSTVDYLP